MKYVLVLTLLVYLLSGCSSRTGQSSSAANNNGQAGSIQTKQSASGSQANLTDIDVAGHLEELATRIPNVESAHVVMFGNTAVVGINVSPQLDRAKVGTTKYSVAEALRKDPYGANAIVTADMDLDQRIRSIRDEIKSGRPISGFTDELGKIVGRIMPQLPRDANPEAVKPNPADNNPSVNPQSQL